MTSRISLKVILAIVATCAAVVALDQISKYMVLVALKDGESVPILAGFFNLVLVYNKGAAFGLFSGVADGLRQMLLGLTTLVALGLVLYFLLKDYFSDQVARIALGLIFGGALGNIVDRVRIGKVVDFLDFYLGQYHWPAFNVADSAICIGVLILLLRSGEKKATEKIEIKTIEEPGK